MHTRHAYARQTCILGFGDTDLLSHLCGDVYLSHTFFCMHIKHMAAICFKFEGLPSCPLYICFGKSPQCCLFVALCFYNKARGFRLAVCMNSAHTSNHLGLHLRIGYMLFSFSAFKQHTQYAEVQKTALPSKRMNLCEDTCCPEMIILSLDADSSLVL